MPNLYLIYLRKSRQDRETEESGGIDTLERHRTALLSYAKTNNLSIADIYEEVVSGDTIADRPEMQRLLRAVETGRYAGVLVMEVSRLARGNTRDQGIVAETFQYSNTKILTPSKVYDPDNEFDQEYFEFGLFMSRQEYKSINRRLQRGRLASLSEGKYIAGSAPFGYVRVKIAKQKGYTLEIVPQQGEVVRHIFDLYVNGRLEEEGTIHRYGTFTIAKQLDAQGILSPTGKKWSPSSVKDIVTNPVYAGMLRWSYRSPTKQISGGKLTTSCPVNHDAMVVPGLHPPIVPLELWQQAQTILSTRSHAPVPSSLIIKNPFAGLIICSSCGRSMGRQIYKRGRDSLLCPNKDCPTKSSILDEVECAVLDSLRLWLAQYALSDVPDQMSSDTASSVHSLEQAISRQEGSLATLQAQRTRLYDLLEDGTYTTEIFLERSKSHEEKAAALQATLAESRQQLSNLQTLSKQQTEIIPRIQSILDIWDTLATPQEKNSLLKEVLEKIEYTKTEGTRYTPSNMTLHIFPKLH